MTETPLPRLTPTTAIAALSLLATVVLLLLPVPEGVDARAFKGAAIVVFAIGYFATGALPEFLTALAFFAIAVLAEVAAPPVVFSGFASTAIWLMVGGLIIGIAIEVTGLGQRLARGILKRSGTAYPRVVAGVILMGIALAFLMPSTMGRVVILIPIVLALSDRLGFAKASKGRLGLIMAMAFGTWMPSAAILPANVPNMVLVGSAEQLFDVSLTYGPYLLLHFPVTGILKGLVIYGLVLWLFPDTPPAKDEDCEVLPPMSGQERRLSLILGITLLLWITDFIHGVSPAWISLSAAVACMLPWVGLVTPELFKTKFNFPTLIYTAAILAIGAIVVDTGLGQLLGDRVIAELPLIPGRDAINFFALVGIAVATGMIATAPGVPAILVPLAPDLADQVGLPLLTVLMTQVIGYSTILLPYQVPPLVVAIQMAGVSMALAARFTLILAVATFVLLVPANYLWWRALGHLSGS